MGSTTERWWVETAELHAVGTQNVARAAREGEFLCVAHISVAVLGADARAEAVAYQVMGKILRSSLRRSDTVGKIAEPSELAVVLPNIQRLEALALLEQIGRVLRDELAIDGALSASVGLCEFDPSHEGPDFASLLEAARLDAKIPLIRWS
ncbi:MAG: hypothetical protein JWM85_1815 [Acidimicrobiaceae bacterium]|nr:hypothetical protein [Acidimicrobiaceae bacterium]